MHIKLIKNDNVDELEKELNEIIHKLYSVTSIERNYTIIKDIKITQGDNQYLAMIIFDR